MTFGAGVTAQTPKPTPSVSQVPPAPAPPVLETDARQVREQFESLLMKYPPEIGRILKMDPTMLTNQQYLAQYPGIQQFIAAHPEIARNPSFYLEFVRQSYDYTRPSTRRVAPWTCGGDFRCTGGVRHRGVHFRNAGLAGEDGPEPSPLAAHVSNSVRSAHEAARSFCRHERTAGVYPDARRTAISRGGADPGRGDAPATVRLPRRSIGSCGRCRRVSCWSSAASRSSTLAAGSCADVDQGFWAIGILATALGLGFILAAAFSFVISRRLGLFESALPLTPKERGDSSAV